MLGEKKRKKEERELFAHPREESRACYALLLRRIDHFALADGEVKRGVIK